MSGYILINNYSTLGKTGISRQAVISIAERAVGEVQGASLPIKKKAKGIGSFSIADRTKLTIAKDGTLLLQLSVAIEDGNKLASTCEAIQKQVASVIAMSCETLPCEVRIKVVKVGQ